MYKRQNELRPKVERDGNGLTELEFALTMLLHLGIINSKQLRPFIKLFRKLNVTNDGRLGPDDLKLSNLIEKESSYNTLAAKLDKFAKPKVVAEASLASVSGASSVTSPGKPKPKGKLQHHATMPSISTTSQTSGL